MAKTKYTYNEKRKEWYTLVYDGTLTPSGAKHRKRITSKKSSADLEKKVNAFKMDLEQSGAVMSNITFGEYAQQWLETSKATREYNTIRMYRTTLGTCFGTIEDVPIGTLTHSMFQTCINLKADYPRTCQNMYITFKQIIKSAVRDHLLPPNSLFDITDDISLPKYLKPEKRPLNSTEKKALALAELSDMKRAFVTVLYYCGLRKQEALALAPSDFDFKENTVSISKVVIFNGNASFVKPYTKSDRGMRKIPLPDPSQAILKNYVDKCGSTLFHGQNKPYMTSSSYKRMWESIITSMNVALGYNPNAKKDRGEKPIQNLSAHAFRHNYCTELCYQVPRISTKMIARLLGDTEKMVIEVYSHLVEERENAAEVVNDVFNM